MHADDNAVGRSVPLSVPEHDITESSRARADDQFVSWNESAGFDASNVIIGIETELCWCPDR